MILRNEAYLAAIGLDVGDKGVVKLERLSAHPELVDLLGLRWLTSVHDLSELGYPRLNDPQDPVGLYENPDPLPLGFLVGCAVQVDEPLAALMTSDPRQVAIVEAPTSLPNCDDGARVGRVSSVERSPTELRFETRSEVDTILVDARTWYPGWEARVDGNPTPVIRANLAFRGIELGAGQHSIVLRYRPTWGRLAAGSSTLGLLGLIAWIGFRRRRSSLE